MKNNNFDEGIPKFKSEKEECEFWQKNDSADIIDWEKAKKQKFENLKKTKTSSAIAKNE